VKGEAMSKKWKNSRSGNGDREEKRGEEISHEESASLS